MTEIRLKLHSGGCNVTHLEIISHIHEPRGGGDKAPRNVTVPGLVLPPSLTAVTWGRCPSPHPKVCPFV